MFFRKWPSMALGAGVAVALTLPACSVHLGEEPQDALSMQLGNNESGCLTGMSDTLVEFWEGRVSEAKVGGLWDCASRSFQLFMDRTRGAQPGVYTPNELRNFLERYFIKDFHVPDELLGEIMELKKAVLGGQANVITRDELQRSRELIAIIKKHTLILRPYMPLSPKHYSQASEEFLESATLAMEAFARELGAAIEETRNPYPFSHFDQLLVEVYKISETREVKDFIQLLRRRMTTIRALKSTLIAPDSEQIIGREWAKVLAAGAKWHASILKYYHLDANYPTWRSGQGRLRFINLVYEVIDLLDESVARHPDEVIAFPEMDRLIDSLDAEDLPVSPAALKNFLRPLVRRGLSRRNFGPNGRSAFGLNRFHLRRVREIVQRWSDGQRYLESLFHALAPSDGLSHVGFVPEDLLSISAEGIFGQSRSGIPAGYIEAASRLRRIISTQKSLFSGMDVQVTLNAGSMDRRFSFSGLSQTHLLYEIVETAMEAYVEDPNRNFLTRGVSLEELMRVYRDTQQIGIELKLYSPEPENERVVAKRFRDADLFNFASNGDGRMSLDEAVYQLAYMISGKLSANDTHHQIERICPNGSWDVFDFPVLNVECYRREFFSRFESRWARFPSLAAYYRGLSPTRKQDFDFWYEKAARRRGDLRLEFDSTDSESMSVLPHYLETIYARYDRNHSGGIDAQEAELIFPVVRGHIAQLAEGRVTDDSDYLAILTYLLKYGEVPDDWHEYIPWRLHLTPWDFEADRIQILKILAYIASHQR